MKVEWKKQEKELYLPKAEPVLVTVPKQKFFTIRGEGNPNEAEFAEKVGTLYSLAYAVRMMPKKGFTPEGYEEYTVFPLEGVWDLSEKGRQSEILDKNQLVYTIMIRQPEFVTEEVVQKAFEIARKKEDNPLLEQVRFETIEEGLSVQMLHMGPFDTEAVSFEKMKQFIEKNKLQRRSLVHKEIYISDFRKTAPEKLKTVLRYWVEKI